METPPTIFLIYKKQHHRRCKQLCRRKGLEGGFIYCIILSELFTISIFTSMMAAEKQLYTLLDMVLLSSGWRLYRQTCYYWVYWGMTYFTVLTWILAVLAAALDAWVKYKPEESDEDDTPSQQYSGEYETLRLQYSLCNTVTHGDMCSLCECVMRFEFERFLNIEKEMHLS